MKKVLFTLVMSIFGVMSMFAQDELVATLVSDEGSQQFYGQDALAEACEAAHTGDQIILSGGSFKGVTLYKAVKIRGAGMWGTPDNVANPTKITTAITVNLPEGSSTVFKLEDLNIKSDVTLNGNVSNNAKIERCYISSLQCTDVNIRIIHGYISGAFGALRNNEKTLASAYCQNSYVSGIIGKWIIDNCNLGDYVSLKESTLTNCIIRGTGQHISSDNRVFYCISTNGGSNFADINNSTNTATSINFPVANRLSDEDAAKYLGDDGTVVGMYGGSNPFTDKSPYPIVKKLAVKSNNVDGVLKVKIDVE